MQSSRHWSIQGSGRTSSAVLALIVACLATLAGTAGVAAAASGSAGGGAAVSTSLWPRFSTPTVVFDVDVSRLDHADYLTASSLQGVYNGEQHPSRLYLDSGWVCATCQISTDSYLLANTLPSGIHVVHLSPPDNETALQMLLKRFRGFIGGAIETDPANKNTVDLAATMAGLDRAIVIDPSQEPLISSLGIKVLYSFDTPAFTADSAAQTYEWGVQNLLPETSKQMLVVLDPAIYPGGWDYGIATRSFFFWLTSTDSAQAAVMDEILAHTPANTPIMGFIQNENPDVAHLSARNHFLTGSNQYINGSVWAAMPSPSSLSQVSLPAPIAAQANTVYVAFLVSEGDNSEYVQHRMVNLWRDPNLGSVPVGWTIAPGEVDFSPTMLEYFYQHEPKNSELVAGPSGIGYATQMSGPALDEFAHLTSEIMRQDGLNTVDSWEALGNLDQYAQSSAVSSISINAPVAYERAGQSNVMGQTSAYIAGAQQLFCTLDQQSAGDQAGRPLFLEPLVDAWTLGPTDVLHISQQFALAAKASGMNVVFTTPTELAQTMQRYYAGQEAGLPVTNVQSMTGAQVLAEPLVSGTYPTGTVQVTGPNLVTNPSGGSGTAGWTVANGSATLSATTYQGSPALQWNDTTTTGQTWIHYYPAVQNGQTYTFSVDVAGSGQIFLDVYTGTSDVRTIPINLTSSYQKLTWTATIPANAPGGQTGQAPQLQVRESGAGPVSAYISDASVVASTAPC